MERRGERRGILDRAVMVSLLKSPQSALNAGRFTIQSFEAQTIDVSDHGMRLLVPRELVPGTMIKIETDTAVLRAEICHCNRVNDERFAVGVKVAGSATQPPKEGGSPGHAVSGSNDLTLPTARRRRGSIARRNQVRLDQ
jgi:hypothetical protein